MRKQDKGTRGQGEKQNDSTPSTPSTPSPPSPNWNEICCQSLEADNHRRLTTNPLTSADGVTFALDEVYLPLGLVKRSRRERRDGDVHPGKVRSYTNLKMAIALK